MRYWFADCTVLSVTPPLKLTLPNLKLSHLTQLGKWVRTMGANARSLEQVAQEVTQSFHDGLVDEQGRRACVLVRFYKTIAAADLPDDLQSFAAQVGGGGALDPATRCLTLLGTSGDEPEWNDRHASAGHRAIPLPSEQAVAAIPMISQLIAQLGLPVAAVIHPDPTLVLELEQQTYNVFFVPEAKGSPSIPAQDFVAKYKVRSVVGFGGVLPNGSVFAMLLFSRIALPRTTANALRNIALNLKLAVLPHSTGKVFATP